MSRGLETGRYGSNRETKANKKMLIAGMHGDWTSWREAALEPSKDNYYARRLYRNNYYTVMVADRKTLIGAMLQVMIVRHDGKMVNSWKEKQRVKDSICGEERVAVEIYPRKEDIVDEANMAHLWVLPAGFEFPFGLHFEFDGMYT